MSPVPPDVLLVDYGMGNLRNVARAFERAGAKAEVTTDPERVRRAPRVVVPGVGACGDAMSHLSERGLDTALRERIGNGDPFLGICLGLHVLLERGEEGPTDCLGVVPGTVARFPDSLGLAVPHMGWNLVEPTRTHPVLREGYYYFVHAYRAVGVPEHQVAATTDYGGPFVSAIAFDNVVAVQYHPEKSQREGLALIERFCAWSP